MHRIEKYLTGLYRRLPVIAELLRIEDYLSRVSTKLSDQICLEATRIDDFEIPRHPRYSEERRLYRCGFQVCSEHGEDGMIHEIFRRIGTTNKVFAEVGVGDGSENNTAFLLTQGWKGYWVDGNDEFVKNTGRPDLQPGALRWKVCFVRKENIEFVFNELEVPREFDLLSLDIDRNTYYAWEGLAYFRPRVVVVEYNAALPPDVVWKVNYVPLSHWDVSQNFGASLKAFELLARDLGYSLVGCDFTGVNAFFVRDDLVGDHFTAPFTAENHYEPIRYKLTSRRGHRKTMLDIGRQKEQ